MQTKRIAVTGEAGFLGSHLCEKLLDQGHEIWPPTVTLEEVLKPTIEYFSKTPKK